MKKILDVPSEEKLAEMLQDCLDAILLDGMDVQQGIELSAPWQHLIRPQVEAALVLHAMQSAFDPRPGLLPASKKRVLQRIAQQPAPKQAILPQIRWQNWLARLVTVLALLVLIWVGVSSGLQQVQAATQAAVPAPFAQAFFNGQLGLNTAFIWQHNQITRKPTEQQFTGSNLGITAIGNGQYLYTWERNQLLPGAIAITNLEFVHLNRFGFPASPLYRITDNQSASLETEDRYLSLTPLSDTTLAGVWKRTKADTIAGQRKINENIYLSVFDTSGNMLLSQYNLTQNDLWRGQSDLNIPYFFLPKVARSTQTTGRLLLVWAEERLTAQGSQSDIFYALLTQTGQVITPATKLTNSSPLTNRYNNPSVLALPNGRFFLAYNLYPLIGESQLAYAVLDENGGILQAQTSLAGSAQALSPDIEQLSSGEIFMGWHTSPENHIGFVSLNSQTYVPLHTPILTDTPKNRAPGEVAVTRDASGHGVITWYEVEQSDYLSYLLADSAGNLVTPPMIYRFGYGENPNIYSNVYGAGSAVYEGMWQVALPLIRR
ncbi:MAG: hypothetical protein OHK0052_16270 [Anaerolineales bacterium]